MSGMEIERKFLVRDSSYRQAARSSSHIQQGYLSSGRGCTVRVRLRDDEAYLTIKGPSADGGLSRYEFEKAISRDEGEHLLQLCEPGIIDKTRYLVDCGSHTFEVDEFHGDNQGLVMAEVELRAADEPYERPPFLGDEVTGDRRYYNSHLRRYPYKDWPAV
ncbi:MAG: CYTH domain-containing protein [Prevotella sp.]|nr:CYTH domain-containing protein [Prevotella sp.]